MAMDTFLQIWFISAVILVSAHLSAGLLIDGCMALGLWEKVAISLFILLGPLGLLLEAWLLFRVFADILSQLSCRRIWPLRPRANHPAA